MSGDMVAFILAHPFVAGLCAYLAVSILFVWVLSRIPRDPEDEKHVHPLQLDVIDRSIALWSNPGENVLTPFMGVGSEVYGAVMANRRGIGVELKTSYFNQAGKNIEAGLHQKAIGDVGLLPLFHDTYEIEEA